MLTTKARESMHCRIREIEEELEQLALTCEDELTPTEREDALRSELDELEAALYSDDAANRRRAGRREGE